MIIKTSYTKTEAWCCRRDVCTCPSTGASINSWQCTSKDAVGLTCQQFHLLDLYPAKLKKCKLGVIKTFLKKDIG